MIDVLRYGVVRLLYRELPGDVEISADDNGRFKALRASEPGAHLGLPQPTIGLAREVALTYLNTTTLLRRADDCLRDPDGRVPTHLTREQYERACAEVNVIRLPDSACRRLEYASFEPPRHDAETIVTGSLAVRRCFGIVDDERRQYRNFGRDLANRPWFNGLSRGRYETMCALIGVEPAAEAQISALKVECFQQEETKGMADLRLMLAKWRDTGRHHDAGKA